MSLREVRYLDGLRRASPLNYFTQADGAILFRLAYFRLPPPPVSLSRPQTKHAT